MKDGRTHLAHKVEHAVDLADGAVVAVTVQDADAGDTTIFAHTTLEAMQRLDEVEDDPDPPDDAVGDRIVQEVVVDKGGHSNQMLVDLEEVGIRSYISEPNRRRRRWKGKSQEQSAVCANRRRIRGRRGKRLLRKRAELCERSFVHTLDTGGTRRTPRRGNANIRKRQLLHVSGFNLGLVMRTLIGAGTPRGLQGRLRAALAACSALARAPGQRLAASRIGAWIIGCWSISASSSAAWLSSHPQTTSATGC